MHDGVWDRGDYIPYYFLNLLIIFMKKLAHVVNKYLRNILKIIFLFLDHHVFFTKFIIILDVSHCTFIYQIIL